MKNNLIALLDMTFPGVNNFFDSPARLALLRRWSDPRTRLSSCMFEDSGARGYSLRQFTDSHRNL